MLSVKSHLSKDTCFLMPPLPRRFLFRRIGQSFHHTACTQLPAVGCVIASSWHEEMKLLNHTCAGSRELVH